MNWRIKEQKSSNRARVLYVHHLFRELPNLPHTFLCLFEQRYNGLTVTGNNYKSVHIAFTVKYSDAFIIRTRDVQPSEDYVQWNHLADCVFSCTDNCKTWLSTSIQFMMVSISNCRFGSIFMSVFYQEFHRSRWTQRHGGLSGNIGLCVKNWVWQSLDNCRDSAHKRCDLQNCSWKEMTSFFHWSDFVLFIILILLLLLLLITLLKYILILI